MSTESSQTNMFWSEVLNPHFFQVAWEQQPMRFPNLTDPAVSHEIVDWKHVEALARFFLVGENDFRMVFRGKHLARDAYTNEQRSIDFTKLRRYYSGGATMIWNRVQDYSNPLLSIARELEQQLRGQVWMNLYATPAGSRGFNIHMDNHDVFVWQIKGRKIWRFYDTPMPLLNGQVDRKHLHQSNEKLAQEWVLETGDMLYVPRGLAHAALTAEDEESWHLTIGVDSMYGSGLVEAALARMMRDDVEFRKAIAQGQAGVLDAVDLQQQLETLLDRMKQVGELEGAVQEWRESRMMSRAVVEPEDVVSKSALQQIYQGNTCQYVEGASFESREDGVHLTVPYRMRMLKLREDLLAPLKWMQQQPVFSPDELTLQSGHGDRCLFCWCLANMGLVRLAD